MDEVCSNGESLPRMAELIGSPGYVAAVALNGLGLGTQETSLGRLGKLSLVQRATDRLRVHLLAGPYVAGQELPSEAELARMLGVSRTVVREAICSLHAEGLVDVSQGRRSRLRPADSRATVQSLAMFLHRSEGSLMQLVETRRPLEAEIAALAAERATPEQIARMEDSVQRQRDARTLEEKVEADMLFHRRLAEATGNPVFGVLLEAVAGLLRESRRHTISRNSLRRGPEGGLKELVDSHLLILDAVKRHDSGAARKEMLEHLDLTRRDLSD